MNIKLTPEFVAWQKTLRDQKARARIAARIERVRRGALGDHRSVGNGVQELRIDFGPGYRVYFARRGGTLIILLTAGDKGSQRRDIAKAKQLAKEY